MSAVEIPILKVALTSRGEPPPRWCLPNWTPLVNHFDSQARKVFVNTACRHTDECDVPPEELRQIVEAGLRKLPVWGNKRLSIDAYTVARNIQSEFGSGSPAERAAIGLAAINRARAAGSSSVTQHLVHRTSGRYGKQIGSIRPASTAQDPSVANILLADLIVGGKIRDFTGGATHYFDRVTQDYSNQKRPSSPTGEDVYLDWTAGGDFLTWLGHLPGIRPWRLALLKRRPELKPRPEDSAELRTAKITARNDIREAGHAAVMGLARAPAPWDTCMEAVASAVRHATFGDAMVDPPLPALEDREGIATAIYCIFLGGVAGLAAGAMVARPGRRRVENRHA